tara:strand:- start:16 stop:717 length:702 start_codon:yes stop_codon:yes gene_type:complete
VKWILFSSHNSLPPDLETFFMEKLEESSGGVSICSVIKEARTDKSATFGDLRIRVSGGVFEKNNWASYYEQMRRGIEAIEEEDPDAIVYMAEHDVLYPPNYFENEPTNDLEILKNFHVKILNRKAFYPFETYLHSQTIASLRLWKYCLAEDVPDHVRFKNVHEGRYLLRRIHSETAVVDVRHGVNYSGGRNPRQDPEDHVPGWGDHASLWKEIESRLPERLLEIVKSERWGGK